LVSFAAHIAVDEVAISRKLLMNTCLERDKPRLYRFEVTLVVITM
jgi:hypothetical protein